MMQTGAAQPVTFKNVMDDHITRIALMNAAAGATVLPSLSLF